MKIRRGPITMKVTAADVGFWVACIIAAPVWWAKDVAGRAIARAVCYVAGRDPEKPL